MNELNLATYFNGGFKCLFNCKNASVYLHQQNISVSYNIDQIKENKNKSDIIDYDNIKYTNNFKFLKIQEYEKMF